MDEKLIKKIERTSEQLADEIKYLYMEHIVGHASAVLGRCIKNEDRVNPIPEEYFDAIMDGLINSFYGGCEPEFETEEQWKRWEKGIEVLKSCEWSLDDSNTSKWSPNRSPYLDKSIRFLKPTIKFEQSKQSDK